MHNKTLAKTIFVKNTHYKLPIYLPDATRAVVKGLDTNDLIQCNIEGVVVNTLHLTTEPGTEVLKTFEGVKNFMKFNGLVVSDSGGWQVFSLIKRYNFPGKITDEGIKFKIGSNSKNQLFTPEKSIEMQFSIGSDIVICLDDFSSPDLNYKQTKQTVDRTIYWAKKCKQKYNELLKANNLTDQTRPLIFSVIQGGNFRDLREYCAQELLNIGFDGYGYGGYPINEQGELDLELSEFIAHLIPNNFYKFALGIGRPKDIINLHKMGWDIFDCTLPTRDGRHKRLYVYENDITQPLNHSYIYINKSKYANDNSPICTNCTCPTCKNYSKAYLNHLFKINDTLAYRLAAMHNITVYTKLISQLRNNMAN